MVLSTEPFGSIAPPQAFMEALARCGPEHAALDTLHRRSIEGRMAARSIAKKLEAISNALIVPPSAWGTLSEP